MASRAASATPTVCGCGRFAAWSKLHYTDAMALLEIVEAEQRGDPLSPARLSERISLTSGATTALIYRLERAHHVVRTREHADRRVVTLHTTEHVGELASTYFGPLGDRLDTMMSTTGICENRIHDPRRRRPAPPPEGSLPAPNR